MTVIIVFNDGNVSVYGNFKAACEYEEELNYHRDKMKMFPIRIGDDICIEKHFVVRGRREKKEKKKT